MREQIKRILSETDKPETKIEKTVSINYDGKQYFVRIPKKISDYFKITERDKIKFMIDIPYIKENKRKLMVVEVVEKKKK